MSVSEIIEACVATVNNSRNAAMKDLAVRFMNERLMPFLIEHGISYTLSDHSGLGFYCDKSETNISQGDLRKAFFNESSCVDDVVSLRGRRDVIAQALDLLIAFSTETEEGKKLYEYMT